MTLIDKKVNVYIGIRVLDDDEEQNDLLKEVFDMAGLSNVEFFDESQLFVDSMHENIHLCIVDESLKKSSLKLQGINVIQILKERFPKVQSIFFSGTNDPKILKELIRLKPDGYVDKNEGDYLNILVKVVLERLSEIRKNLEMAIAFESYKNGQ